MTPEYKQPPELSPEERREFADTVIEAFGLQAKEGLELEMYGERGTFREGLERCAPYMVGIKDASILKIRLTGIIEAAESKNSKLEP